MRKKIIILLLMVMFPNIIFATTCDTKKQVQYQKLAENINYETSYSKSTNKFTIIFYNVVEGLYLSNGSNSYTGNGDNIATVSNIDEGSSIAFAINTIATNCGSILKTINLTLPYYNTFYDTDRCEEYKDKLSICSSQFLTYRPTNELFEMQVKNYGGITPDDPTPDNPNKTFLDDVIEFMQDWGIQIGIVIVVSVLTIIPFNAKLRKIRHGI